MARKKQKDAEELVDTYTTEITYTCPKRGKVTEKIKVKRYKTAERSYLQEAESLQVTGLEQPEDGFQLADDVEEEL